MKTIQRVYRQPEGHWVGDGFPVHTVLDYQRHPELSPFILLDHFGPADFAPADKRRGVGWHPHRGFETVTVLLEGEVEVEIEGAAPVRVKPGEAMHVEAGKVHKPKSVGTVPAKFISVWVVEKDKPFAVNVP